MILGLPGRGEIGPEGKAGAGRRKGCVSPLKPGRNLRRTALHNRKFRRDYHAASRRSDPGATRPEIPRKKTSPNSYDAKIRRSDRPVNSRIGITPPGTTCQADARVNTTTPTTPPPAPARAPILRSGALIVVALAGRLHQPPRRAFRLRRWSGAHGQSDDPAALAADGRVAPAGEGRIGRERPPPVLNLSFALNYS